MFFNANFSTDGIAFIAEDFLGTGNREERKQEAAMSRIMADRANQELEKMFPADGKEKNIDGVPLWAIPLKNRKPSA